MDRSVGGVVRAVRLRLGWRQTDVARRARVSRSTVARLERIGPASVTLGTLRRICDVLEIDLYLNARWRGGELDRLLDSAHAELQSAFSSVLIGSGWLVRAEVTYSRFGARGSVDLLAFHPPTGTLLVVEIKILNPPNDRDTNVMRAGRQRVRLTKAPPRSRVEADTP